MWPKHVVESLRVKNINCRIIKNNCWVKFIPLTPLLVSAGAPLRDVAPSRPGGVSSSGQAISVLVAEVIIKAQVEAVASSRCAALSISARLGINSKNESKKEKTQDPGHGRSFLASFQTEKWLTVWLGGIFIHAFLCTGPDLFLRDGKTHDLQSVLSVSI